MLDDEIDGELEAVTEVEPDRLEVVLDIELERPDGELDSIVQDTLDKLADILDTGLMRPDDEFDAEFDMVKDEELERLLDIALDNIDDALETEADGLLKVVLESAKGELEIKFGWLLKVEEPEEPEELEEPLLGTCVEDIVPNEEATDEVNDSVDKLDRDKADGFIEDETAEDGVLLNDHDDKEAESDETVEDKPLGVCAAEESEAVELCPVGDVELELIELCTAELELVKFCPIEELEVL
jgi:hypothetical protein